MRKCKRSLCPFYQSITKKRLGKWVLLRPLTMCLSLCFDVLGTPQSTVRQCKTQMHTYIFLFITVAVVAIRTDQLAVLNDEFLSFVHLLLDHPSRLIALESAWLFSVLTGLDGCADAVLSLNVFPTLNRMLFASTELQVEAAHAIVSLISAGEKALRQSLEHDIPAGMGQLFRYNNSELTVCGLSYIDAVCNAVPNAAMEVIPEQALDTIESLQYADNEEISALAKHITDKHFNFDDEEEYEM
eukprot:m.75018 g.75018  ORF g.75018 m.75018 type:complete len:243 (-) comp11830_c0_seq2:26-754(-)